MPGLIQRLKQDHNLLNANPALYREIIDCLQNFCLPACEFFLEIVETDHPLLTPALKEEGSKIMQDTINAIK